MEKIIILDFGSQTTQLIGRRLRDLNEYCEIVPYNKFPEDTTDIKGVILSGSPFSVYDPTAFKTDLSNIRGKFPVLGICYGAQYIAYTSGGSVEAAGSREYGRANLDFIDNTDPLFKDINPGSQIWMSHGDSITKIPAGIRKIASTADVELAAYKIENEPTWAVQFHFAARKLPEYLWCFAQLVTGFVCGKHSKRTARSTWQRQGCTRSFRRC
jgi:GMP synthase (glutamine-hydrolysing)